MVSAIVYYSISALSILKKKSKVLPIICAVLFWILINFSHDHADYGVYIRTYNAIANGMGSAYEILFVGLMKVISLLGVDYDSFRMIVSTAVVVGMYFIIKDYSFAPSSVWGVYLIFSSIYDAPLMRHLIGMPIILFGIRYLDDTETDKKKIRNNDIHFLVCVTLAALTHSAFWYFLVVWAVFKIKDYKTLGLFVSIFTIAGLMLTSTNIVFYIFRLLPIREHLIAKYMTGLYRNFNGRIYDLLKQGMIAGFGFLSYFANKQVIETESGTHEKRLLFNHTVLRLNIVMFTMVPFLAYTPVLQRLNRVLIITNYCMWSNSLCRYRYRDARWLGLVLIGVIFAVILLVLLLFYESQTLDTIFYMHFKENDIFSFFNFAQ